MSARSSMVGSAIIVLILGGSNLGIAGMAVVHILNGAHEGWLLAWMGHTVLVRDVLEFWAERFRLHRTEHRRATAASESEEVTWHG